MDRRFVPCTRQVEQLERFMGAIAQARQMARGKVDSSWTIEREDASLKIDWGIIRREQYDEIKHKVLRSLMMLI